MRHDRKSTRVLRFAQVVLCLVSSLSAAQEICDPLLPKYADDHPLGYKLIGDRCEGLFVQQVSGSIQVVSVHFAPLDLSLGTGESVQLQWRCPLNEAKANNLRAVSLKTRVFYRMDTLRPAGSTSYNWRTELLQRIPLSGTEVGVVSWISAELNGSDTKLFCPIFAHSQSGKIEVVLRSDLTLHEIYLGLVPLDEAGRSEDYLFQEKPLKYGPYATGSPISIELPTLENTGVYRLEIAVIFKNDTTSNLDVLFYFPGE